MRIRFTWFIHSFFLALVVLLAPELAVAGNLFDGAKGERTQFIWPSIPFIRGADLQAFQESYGRSRSVLRWEAIEQAVQIMEAGATGAEALEIVLSFDHQITKNRWRSTLRMGVSLEGFFNSKLDALYEQIRPKQRHLAFRQVVSPLEIIGNASSSMRPGRMDQQGLSKIDFIIYGSYSTSQSKSAGIHLFLYIVNVRTGVTRTLSAGGTAQQAAESVAAQLFQLFQKTRFPSTISYGGGKKLTVIDSLYLDGYANVRLDSLYQEAFWSCEDLGGRLPSFREMSAVMRAGDFGGGVSVNVKYQDHYYWALSRDQIFAATMRKSLSKSSVGTHRYLRFVCIR